MKMFPLTFYFSNNASKIQMPILIRMYSRYIMYTRYSLNCIVNDSYVRKTKNVSIYLFINILRIAASLILAYSVKFLILSFFYNRFIGHRYSGFELTTLETAARYQFLFGFNCIRHGVRSYSLCRLVFLDLTNCQACSCNILPDPMPVVQQITVLVRHIVRPKKSTDYQMLGTC